MWLSAQRGWLGSLSCRKERVSESWWEQAAPDQTPMHQQHIVLLWNAESMKNARGADLKVKTFTSRVNTLEVKAAGTVSKPKYQKQICSFPLQNHCRVFLGGQIFPLLLFKVSNAHERWSLGHFCLRRLTRALMDH